MIRKSLIFALLLLAGYSVFVERFAPSDWQASQHQWQENLIKAQRYVYSGAPPSAKMIVGSSLAQRLVMEELPGFANLSLGGQSIYDGLSILTHQSQFPRTAYIEMNMMLREETLEFTEALNSPVMYYPRKWLLSLREDRQPLGVLGSRFNKGVTEEVIPWLKSKVRAGAPVADAGAAADLFPRLLEAQREVYAKTPGKDLLETRFRSLEGYVRKLQGKGVAIVFFEMPVNSSLMHLPQAETIRAAFRQHFPEPAFRYIEPPADDEFRTVDGVHLSPEEALRYTGYFQSKANALAP